MLVVENQPQNQEEGEGPPKFSHKPRFVWGNFKNRRQTNATSKPLQEINKPISKKMWVIANLPKNRGPQKIPQTKDNYANI